ncbi:MAG TPA: hypothetical protein VHP63_04665, partial [candidate division Zixibacteria bacterium]|nr:hypothetical protein [candidate division Zixibacteria bacterium]
MRFAKLIGAVCFCLVTSLSASAAVPQVINYQGLLTGTGGAALDTTADVTFRIFDVASGGAALWTETQSVTSVDGLFSVLLGINTPIDETTIDGADRFLEVQLNASPFSPRTQLGASPYAIRIATVDGASGGTISSDLNITGNVGIGTASPQAPLEVYYDNLNPLAPAIAIN